MDILSLLGNCSSLLGAVFSLWQASKAKNAATIATEAQKKILKHQEISDLSQILMSCRQCANTFSKYGPAATSASLTGAPIQKDAEQVQNLALYLREHRFYYSKKDSLENTSDEFCNRIEKLLANLVSSKSFNKQKEFGSNILYELSNFISLTRNLIEEKKVAYN